MSKDIRESSIVETHHHAKTPIEQFKVPTWGLVVVLFITLVVLKSFIYIKDEKRHGK